ncbi:STAS domain-containing protein [Dyella kyungheensis]|uniref:STAS domain-containing protein n=1 Tax=Dyella kyungheensis TaxID=1242174 RepID=A0ABS2JTE8_9GAMM|nr:STAS domain-containing protein [Dyella kyungheensis]MBM7122090.1 STAS domain-containing protein [Dyella kyungheensis]
MSILKQATIDAIKQNESALLTAWIAGLEQEGSLSDNRITRDEVSAQAKDFLRLLVAASAVGDAADLSRGEWAESRQFLELLSRSRAQRGLDSQHTARFIFSLKRPLFDQLQTTYAGDPKALSNEVWAVSELLDLLGMHTIRAFQKSREEVIMRQQEELLELSTPVVKLWDGVLALPMIGTLDSQRTQVVMESLLQRIVETGSDIAIIDITGVPTVDTLVAQHLLKTVTAIRLMGADCIISGIRPQIAQTIVHLGLDLGGIVTKANLADALALALKRSGLTVTRAE